MPAPHAAPSTDLLTADVLSAFAPQVTYLNTAVYGLPPRAATEAALAAERDRLAGVLDPVAVEEDIAACRTMFGQLVGTDAGQVAVGTQVSQLVGLVAAALPPGATVIVPQGEFTSVSWPQLVRRDAGVAVRAVPARDLADAVRPGDDLVAASVVRSSDGAVLDVGRVVEAARSCGARVLLDASQAAGWFPLHSTGADWIVSVGHKWLLGPKGAAFLAGTDEALAQLSPLAAGWYAGRDPWGTSCYSDSLDLAADARRFDVSPVWPAWRAQRIGMGLLLSIGVDTIHRHDLALADRLRTGLGVDSTGSGPVDPATATSAIVSVDAKPQAIERLGHDGVAAAVRDGRLRLSCHLYNTVEDVDRALDLLVP